MVYPGKPDLYSSRTRVGDARARRPGRLSIARAPRPPPLLWLPVRRGFARRLLAVAAHPPSCCRPGRGVGVLHDLDDGGVRVVGHAKPASPRFTTLRFLLPVFALLSLPVATALIHIARRGSGRWRKATAVVVAAGLSAHVGLMLVKAERELDESGRARAVSLKIARAIQPHVKGRECLLISRLQAAAFHLGCDVQPPVMPAHQPRRVRRALPEGQFVIAVLTSPPTPGSYLATWRVVPIHGLPSRFRAYLPPAQ